MTPTVPPNPELLQMLDEAAKRYQRSLSPEHYMEATPQSTQRKITLESFDLIHEARPEIQCFNELLVQYVRRKRQTIGQVVPDNFVVVHPRPIEAIGHYSLHLQPVRPLLVLEYVSKHSERKDYNVSFEKYEEELKVPYYLLFYPDNEELTLFHLVGERYVSVIPNEFDRLPIPELELEVALHEGWVRFWFRGELLPLPGALLRERNLARRQRDEAQRQRDEAQRQRDEAQRQRDAEHQARLAAEMELAQLREQLDRAKGAS